MRRSNHNGLKGSVFSYFLSLFLITTVYGAIPGVSIPGLGQVLWASGFAESFVNAGGLATKATNFGLPEPAAIPLGLPGVLLQSLLIQCFHLHAADAYSVGAIVWLALALVGAIQLCRFLGGSFRMGSALAPIYLCLPIVWAHSGYSYVSFGFALLPLYLYVSFQLVYRLPTTQLFSTVWLRRVALFFVVSLLSIFMDGYTFVMHAVNFLIVFLTASIQEDWKRREKIEIFLIFLASVILAYVAYTFYLGEGEYNLSSIEMFRGWGVDLAMLVRPSQGVSALWDWLYLSAERSEKLFFGDFSVWQTTFSLPLILVGGLGFFQCRKSKFALPLLLVALFGFYFSLGPSLKFNSIRTEELVGNYSIDGGIMPESAAIAPTGSGLISQSLPGFKNMRASYRWSGLMLSGLFGLTLLLMLDLNARRGKFGRMVSLFLLLALTVPNYPNLPERIWKGVQFRQNMFEIESAFSGISQTLNPEDKVLFLPVDNDFLVNYIAATGNYQAYNIGGDKNLEKARENWPYILRTLPFASLNQCLPEQIDFILKNKISDAVVLTYITKRIWVTNEKIWRIDQADLIERKESFEPVSRYFRKKPEFEVLDWPLYSMILRSSKFRQLESGISDYNNSVVEINESCDARLSAMAILDRGWNGMEESLVWSGPSASFEFSPSQYFRVDTRNALIKLSMSVHAASTDSPKQLSFYIDNQLYSSARVVNGEFEDYMIRLTQDQLKKDKIKIRIEVPDATSPSELSASNDTRILGVALRKVAFVNRDPA